ncbi:MAG TPA: hypothetical protein VK026_01545 [Paenalcaligenes sp.]|nr:hypothetical protein [Paenalcaligenes sp.]
MTTTLFFQTELPSSNTALFSPRAQALASELAENLNLNIHKLLNYIIEAGHAEGPIPNSRHFTNFAHLETNQEAKSSRLILRYNKRYEADPSIYDELEPVSQVLEQMKNSFDNHGHIRSIQVMAEPLNLRVTIDLRAF